MDLDISIFKGQKDKPAVILIHGLGMEKAIWVDPLNTKIFARSVPLKIFAATRSKPCLSKKTGKISMGEVPEKMDSLWSALTGEGFNIICWSQRRPAGPIHHGVEELNEVLTISKRLFPESPVVLIGHSRGGLIARKFMQRKRPGIRALITISTPHAGSSIAGLEKYLRPFSFFLKSILPEDTHRTISRAIKNSADLLQGNALKELLPDSAFFKNLTDCPQKGVSYISFGGTEPRLLTIYIWKRTGKKMYQKPLLSIPDSLLKIIPSFLVMEEIMPGKGDGLVSAKSSLLPWASKHHNLRANHVSILWNRRAIKSIIEALKAI